MEQNNNITEIAFTNGQELSKKIDFKKNRNKLFGTVHILLNNLKISNREGFLENYLKLMMVHNIQSRFGMNGEMEDDDKFLKFGYAFMAGLTGEPNSNHEQA